MISPVGLGSQRQARSRAAETRLRSHLLERWHLLSLDAPAVATVWTWYVAHCARLALPWTELAAMFCAVWVLYAADRLLDARELARGAAAGSPDGLEERHFFHFAHRRAFRWGIGVGCGALAALLPAMMAQEIRLDLTLAALLAGWFVVIHSGRKPLPKELVVGVFFAAAVFLPTVARAPGLRSALLAPAVVFGALCSLNCWFIFAWEHDRSSAGRWAAGLGCGLALTGLAMRGMVLPVGLSAGLLVLLHALRRRVERTTLRAFADLVLLTPLLLWAPR